jgi:Fe-S-cluster-containing dehydrogenase component
MKMNRRDFLKKSGSVLKSGLFLYTAELLIPRVVCTEAGISYDWEKHLYGFVVDTYKCIGCGRCVEACKEENNVPDGFYRTWVERYIITEQEEVLIDSPKGALNGFKERELQDEPVKSFFVPKLCNQCSKPNCVQVCPVGATYKTKDGIILIDDKHCVGCGYCVKACPYGVRYIDHEGRGVADKCTWCYHRIVKGLLPACVLACPVGARKIGDLNDPESEVRRIIEENRVAVLKPELGNEPRVYYLGMDKEVR